MFLVRLGASMWDLAIVLFVLDLFASPRLAGLVLFFGLAPGLVLSPVGGVLLDRLRPSRLIAADLGIGVLFVSVIVIMALRDSLSPALLLWLVGSSSLTLSLTVGGMRTLIPALIPTTLWDRANALDSAIGKMTILLAPLLAGALVQRLGSPKALAAIAVLWLASALIVLSIKEQQQERRELRIWGDTIEGLKYLLKTRPLRNLAIVVTLSRTGGGVLAVAMPVLILDRSGSSPLTVGAMWAIFGASALSTSLSLGGRSLVGRERLIMMIAFLVGGLGLVLLAGSLMSNDPLVWVAVGMVLAGVANGSSEVAMLSYRQRQAESAFWGRTISVSDTIYMIGPPVGSAVAGATVVPSLPGTFVGAAAVMMLGAWVCWRLLTPLLR